MNADQIALKWRLVAKHWGRYFKDITDYWAWDRLLFEAMMMAEDKDMRYKSVLARIEPLAVAERRYHACVKK